MYYKSKIFLVCSKAVLEVFVFAHVFIFCICNLLCIILPSKLKIFSVCSEVVLEARLRSRILPGAYLVFVFVFVFVFVKLKIFSVCCEVVLEARLWSKILPGAYLVFVCVFVFVLLAIWRYLVWHDDMILSHKKLLFEPVVRNVFYFKFPCLVYIYSLRI